MHLAIGDGLRESDLRRACKLLTTPPSNRLSRFAQPLFATLFAVFFFLFSVSSSSSLFSPLRCFLSAMQTRVRARDFKYISHLYVVHFKWRVRIYRANYILAALVLYFARLRSSRHHQMDRMLLHFTNCPCVNVATGHSLYMYLDCLCPAQLQQDQCWFCALEVFFLLFACVPTIRV